MDYSEDFWGIKYTCRRGEQLKITAPSKEFYLSCSSGVLNLMSRSLCGRTALFSADCDFFCGEDDIVIHVHQGTPSYMKELHKVRPMSQAEFDAHNIRKLW